MRPTAFELLEPIVLLSGNTTTTLDDSTFIRSKEVSNFSVAYRKMHDGSIHGVQTDDPIFQLAGETSFDGQQHIEVAHEAAFELSEGTFAMKFTVDDPDPANNTPAVQTLFSKDASGNGDGGHISAYLYEGRIKVRFQSITDSLYLWTPENSIESHQEYHLALTFGGAGAWLYLNGKMADWNIEFTQGLQSNSEAMVIGANTASRSESSPTHVSHRFSGHIVDFLLHDQQYSRHQVATIAGRFRFEPPRVDGREYGTDRDELLTGSDVHGGYGDDTITGTTGNDRLDGGHGEDRLVGGPGDDLLLSRSDGREPVIAQDFADDYDPDGEVDSVTRTLYRYQPIEADDVLVGGPGADTFRFESLISAKEQIILRHVMDNGMIHWHGVAGENDRVHDHWVDRIGDDVIEDFNREEGDKIEIVGHTIDVYDLRHIDSDDDGILDASVLYLQSNQGNAGAHNKDKIGTITVFGDLVFESDYTVDAKPAYGIVDSIFSLDEAIGPRTGTPIIQNGTPPPLPIPSDGVLPIGGVFGLLKNLQFSGERGDHIEVSHNEKLQLDHGTVSLTFTPDDVDGSHALFSKDAYGNADGGHLTAFIHNGRIKVRMQSEDSEAWLKSTDNDSIQVGQEYHLAVTFGSNGVWLFVDGTVVDADVLLTQDWLANTEGMAIGANVWNRSDLDRDGASAHFAGRIRDFVIYDSQFDRRQVAQLAND